MKGIRWLLWFWLLLYPFALSADVALPPVFSDGMVLQRGEGNKVWGWASPRERVVVTFQAKSYRTYTNREGMWEVTLSELLPGGPYDMFVLGKNLLTVKEIHIGDVWLWKAGKGEAAPEEDKPLRSLQNGRHLACFRPEKMAARQKGWMVASQPHELEGSAELQGFIEAYQQRTGMALGIILLQEESDTLTDWIPSSYRATWEQLLLQRNYQQYRLPQSAAGGVRERLDVSLPVLGKAFDPLLLGYTRLKHTGLILPGKIEQHQEGLPITLWGLLNSWQQAFGNDSLRVLSCFPPLATPLGQATYHQLKQLADTTEIALTAAGHVSGKQLGHSLAKIAFRHKKQLSAMAFAFENGKAKVTFNRAVTIQNKYGYPRGFQIAGADRKFHWAKAAAISDTVFELGSPHVPQPVAVRYAWEHVPGNANLSGENGLPILPFRSDCWPLMAENGVKWCMLGESHENVAQQLVQQMGVRDLWRPGAYHRSYRPKGPIRKEGYNMQAVNLQADRGLWVGVKFFEPATASDVPIVLMLHGTDSTAVQNAELTAAQFASWGIAVAAVPTPQLPCDRPAHLLTSTYRSAFELLAFIAVTEYVQKQTRFAKGKIMVWGMASKAKQALALATVIPELSAIVLDSESWQSIDFDQDSCSFDQEKGLFGLPWKVAVAGLANRKYLLYGKEANTLSKLLQNGSSTGQNEKPITLPNAGRHSRNLAVAAFLGENLQFGLNLHTPVGIDTLRAREALFQTPTTTLTLGGVHRAKLRRLPLRLYNESQREATFMAVLKACYTNIDSYLCSASTVGGKPLSASVEGTMLRQRYAIGTTEGDTVQLEACYHLNQKAPTVLVAGNRPDLQRALFEKGCNTVSVLSVTGSSTPISAFKLAKQWRAAVGYLLQRDPTFIEEDYGISVLAGKSAREQYAALVLQTLDSGVGKVFLEEPIGDLANHFAAVTEEALLLPSAISLRGALQAAQPSALISLNLTKVFGIGTGASGTLRNLNIEMLDVANTSPATLADYVIRNIQK